MDICVHVCVHAGCIHIVSFYNSVLDYDYTLLDSYSALFAMSSSTLVYCTLVNLPLLYIMLGFTKLFHTIHAGDVLSCFMYLYAYVDILMLGSLVGSSSLDFFLLVPCDHLATETVWMMNSATFTQFIIKPSNITNFQQPQVLKFLCPRRC